MKKNFVFIMLVVSLVFTAVEAYGQSDAAKAAYNRGYKAFMDSDYDLAIKEFTEAIRLYQNYDSAYFGRGHAYTFKREFDKAIADFTKSIQIAPNSANAYSGRGIAYYRKNDYDRAIADFTKSIQLRPNEGDTYYFRAEAYSAKKDYDRAIADYTQAINLYDVDYDEEEEISTAYSGRGRVYIEKKDYDRAITDFTQALNFDPFNVDANNGLVLARQRKQGSSPSSQPAAPPAQPAPAGMVYIRGGTFMMSSPSNEPERARNEATQRQVTVNSFYMGKYEVTQKEYFDIMGITLQGQHDWVKSFYGSSDGLAGVGDNYPMYYISCYDAIIYCNNRSKKEGLTPAYTIDNSKIEWNRNANGYRLPSGAEWEYACRAGTITPFNTGNNITTNQANYDGNKPYNNNPKGTFRGRTMPVGSFAPNSWGLYDMHGNVSEWSYDFVDDDYAGQDYHGGDWNSGGSYIRSAYKAGGEMFMMRNNWLGFRVVRNAQ
jgi:formylglycine-generating enzyme required for sulfatase activity